MSVDALTGEGRQEALRIIEGLREQPGATLPILHALQAHFGHVPRDTVPLIAEALNLSRAEVHGVLTFYHDFRHEPAARHTIRLCRAEACQAQGGDALAAHAKDRLGLDWGQRTADGAVGLEPVFCLGLCASGPAAQVDAEIVGRLDRAALDALIDRVRK